VVTTLIASGMPKAKIVICIPFYSRAWEDVTADSKDDGLHHSATTTASDNDEADLEDDRVRGQKHHTLHQYCHQTTI